MRLAIEREEAAAVVLAEVVVSVVANGYRVIAFPGVGTSRGCGG